MPVYLEDRQLKKRLLAGDQQAFDRFFEENFARLYRFALVRLNNDREAAAEVQDLRDRTQLLIGLEELARRFIPQTAAPDSDRR